MNYTIVRYLSGGLFKVLTVPRPDKAETRAHGETKVYKQFMMTPTVSEMIEDMATKLNISRSEVIERCVRCGGLQAAERFNPETGACDRDA